MNRLSVVIITFNEEENIGRCMESVKQVADEIVVLDSFSTDRTGQIAIAAGARFEQHIFDGHIEQKNLARKLATNPWVLSLDADETLSYELLAQIISWKSEPAEDLPSGYYMNRLNYYCAKPIKTCGMYPDRKLRLWREGSGSWQGTNPHDRFVLNDGEVADFMKGDILHNTWPTHQAFLNQVDKFATISAQHLKNGGLLYLFFKLIFSAPFKFIRIYFFKAGFTDGITGLTICYHQSREVFLKYWRAIKLKYS